MASTISEVGEKRLIAEVVRPLFDGDQPVAMLGNDCAEITVPAGHRLLISTDRIPADLIAFKLGILDHFSLGRYLVYLNVSDVLAGGGLPSGLLLTMGLPGSLRVDSFEEICRGAKTAALEYDCRIVGGDISGSSELSLAATAFGFVPEGQALNRWGARVGDLVFVSKELGLTPAAFALFLHNLDVGNDVRDRLERHLSCTRPSLKISRNLALSGFCTSCMDNTDGVAQCLSELAEESGVEIVVEAGRLTLPGEVFSVASLLRIDPLNLAFGPGHDLGLVGTIDPIAFSGFSSFAGGISVIGRVLEGNGVSLEAEDGVRSPFNVAGWDYFRNEIPRSRTSDPLELVNSGP
jgi:thiamine-monophosphate kinase